jgi:protein-glucosylgalactosylhydroxylysine glucosidase
MTDGIHTIALLSCGLPKTAAEYFPKSFANAKSPFWVWQETPTGGAVNFITGAEGFLQAIMFGYGGLRVENRNLQFTPQLPPGILSMKLRGVRYRLSTFDLYWDQSSVEIFNLPTSDSTLFVSDGSHAQAVVPGQQFRFPPVGFSVSCV